MTARALKGVIFDWAGTTVDCGSRAPTLAFLELFNRRGIRLTESQARGPMGLHKRAHLEQLAALPEVEAQWLSKFGHACRADEIERMYHEFVPIQLEILPQHSALIPGVLETVRELRRQGLGVGGTTGYTSEMAAIVVRAAERQGFVVDANACASDVPAGRPAPWMAFRVAEKLGVYPAGSLVKVGDTVADIEEGLNAGMWSIGITRTGNEVGLSETELGRIGSADRGGRIERARSKLLAAGAHAVVESVADLVPVLDEIRRKLARGDKP